MNIPSEKGFYKIREVSEVVEVKPYVVRFWETEFNIRPRRTEGNHRIYTSDDLNLVIQIKRLLYDEGYTITGAKRKLQEMERENNEGRNIVDGEKRVMRLINEVKIGLMEIKRMLN